MISSSALHWCNATQTKSRLPAFPPLQTPGFLEARQTIRMADRGGLQRGHHSEADAQFVKMLVILTFERAMH
jgi:hypothetical protein